LLYGNLSLDTTSLKVPHPEMGNRAFVLLPLSEIAPLEIEIPGMGVLKELLQRVTGEGVERLD
jgi:2-amino-4-hydroxy-6-hydroxymethyldihydropteridine diphosphokinase